MNPHVPKRRVSRRLVRRLAALVGAVMAVTALSGAAAADTQLTLLHCWGEQRSQWVDQMAADFSAAHPGVTVKTHLVGCGGTLTSTFTQEFVGGAAPDVTMIHSLDIPGAVGLGALLPLDGFIAAEKIPLGTWYPSEINSARWDGKVYGLPIRTGGDANSLLYTNSDLFAAAGLDPNHAPATWDELRAITPKLVRYGGDGQLSQAALALNGGDYSQLAWLANAGGNLTGRDGRSAAFAAPGTEAATFAADAFARDYQGGMAELNAFIKKSGGMRSAFEHGVLAMQFNGSWEFNYIKTDSPQTNFHMAVRPARTADGSTGMNAGTFHYAVSTQSKSPQLAWELVKWLTLREASAGDFMLKQSRPSPVRAFNRNPAYTQANPDWYVIGQTLDRAESLPIFPYTRQAISLFSKAFDSAAAGTEAPTNAMANAQKQVQAIIDDYWAKQGG